MNVILLTALIGLVLVSFFVAFFLHQNTGQSGTERDALLPLDEENAHPSDSDHPTSPSQPDGKQDS